MKDTVALGRADVCVREPGKLNFYGGYAKRAFDLSLLVLTAPFFVPILLCLWALVRLDGGPGLYSQTRVGQNGKAFEILKLRTMVKDSQRVLAEYLASNPEAAAEWRVMQKLHDDPRVTPLGRFLRKTGLDELPQLLNVLWGDMSLVGPRPFMVEQEEDYLRAGGEAYYRLKPGITGLWQVTARNQASFGDRVDYDNRYLRSMSLLQDVRLLVKTVPAVLRGTGC
ncbi:MAG: sugar transferase [Rhodobacter sp.]|nr:sugar transferase [Rhodobacter sp.]